MKEIKYIGKTTENFIKDKKYELVDFYNGYPAIEAWIKNEQNEIEFLAYDNLKEFHKEWEDI